MGCDTLLAYSVLERVNVCMLEVENLDYQYGAHHVLRSINFTLDAGQLSVLVGVNGAGKSTLLRCIAGWSLPEKGLIAINGIDAKTQEREYREQVIFVSDTPDFYDELSAWEHLQFVGQLHRIPDWDEVADNLLDNFDLASEADSLPFTFSRGMRYKLALCMALLVKPSILLLDEPFAPLDAAARDLLWSQLEAFRDAGHSVMLSAHALPKDANPDAAFLLRNGDLSAIDVASIDDLGEVLRDVD